MEKKPDNQLTDEQLADCRRELAEAKQKEAEADQKIAEADAIRAKLKAKANTVITTEVAVDHTCRHLPTPLLLEALRSLSPKIPTLDEQITELMDAGYETNPQLVEQLKGRGFEKKNIQNRAAEVRRKRNGR